MRGSADIILVSNAQQHSGCLRNIPASIESQKKQTIYQRTIIDTAAFLSPSSCSCKASSPGSVSLGLEAVLIIPPGRRPHRALQAALERAFGRSPGPCQAPPWPGRSRAPVVVVKPPQGPGARLGPVGGGVRDRGEECARRSSASPNPASPSPRPPAAARESGVGEAELLSADLT